MILFESWQYHQMSYPLKPTSVMGKEISRIALHLVSMEGFGMTAILFLVRNSGKADGEGAGHELIGKLTHVPTVSQNTLK